MMASCPFVDISGTPYERGLQYGKAVPEMIRRSIELYGGQLADIGYNNDEKLALIAEFTREIESFSPAFMKEMQGIADGAKVTFEDIVMVNARTEIIAKARLDRNQPIEAQDDHVELDDGCTGVVILPDRTTTNSVIHAQNWDWRAECAETAIVLRIRRDDGPDIMTFVEAGGLARCGMNSAGICITANYLESNEDFTKLGIPLSLIRRKALEQEHLAFAMKIIATTPKSCSNNLIVSSAMGFAIDFECSPDEAFPIYPENDMIVHANHWVGSIALTKIKDTGIPRVPESFYRDWRVRKLLDKVSGKISVDDVKNALFDDFLTPHSVCRPPRPNDAGNLSATVAMVIMDPANGRMEVALLPAINRTFTSYSLVD